MTEGQDEELDARIGKASAVMRALHYSVVIKQKVSKKAKLLIFRTVFIPILTCGHESWDLQGFYVESKELHYLTRCIALKFENL